MANPIVMVAVLLMVGVIAALGLSVLGDGVETTTGADFAVFHTAGELAAAVDRKPEFDAALVGFEQGLQRTETRRLDVERLGWQRHRVDVGAGALPDPERFP